MHTSGHQYILFSFLFQIMVNKKPEKVWNLQKSFSLRTIKVCRFEIIGGVKYIYCIKHADKFLLREQVGYAAVFDACVNVFLVVIEIKNIVLRINLYSFVPPYIVTVGGVSCPFFISFLQLDAS